MENRLGRQASQHHEEIPAGERRLMRGVIYSARLRGGAVVGAVQDAATYLYVERDPNHLRRAASKLEYVAGLDRNETWEELKKGMVRAHGRVVEVVTFTAKRAQIVFPKRGS